MDPNANQGTNVPQQPVTPPTVNEPVVPQTPPEPAYTPPPAPPVTPVTPPQTPTGIGGQTV